MTPVTKIFLDTSIFIRFLTRDIEEKYEECKELLALVESGRIKPYISNIVLAEIVFVLTRQYKFPKVEILKDSETILQTRNLTLLEETDTPQALKLYKKYNIKYQDCLIVTQLPRGVTIATYDKDFSKVKSLSAATPEEILKNPRRKF